MPLIMPIKDLRNTTEISNIAHKEQEPIFITKNGYSDLVVMSSELYDKFAKMNRIDQAIFESEQEIANGAEAVDAEIVFAELEKKRKCYIPSTLYCKRPCSHDLFTFLICSGSSGDHGKSFSRKLLSVSS